MSAAASQHSGIGSPDDDSYVPSRTYFFSRILYFPFSGAEAKLVADLRLIRRRNRASAQRNYTFQRLERWNRDRAALLHELLNPVGAVGNPLVSKAHSHQENCRRAERLIREDDQLG